MRTAFFCLTGLLALACSSREHNNPLDPLNLGTHGMPTGFQAVADGRMATLTWDPVAVNNLTGYLISRGVDGEPPAPYDTVSFAVTRFLDSLLAYDVPHVYAIQTITTTSESAITTPDTVIPGPFNFWVADYNDGSVWRISYDGSHVLGWASKNSPSAIAYEPNEDRIWVADFFDKVVYILDTQLLNQEQIDLDGRPIDLAFDVAEGNVYVLQTMPDAILLRSVRGGVISPLPLPDTLNVDSKLSFNSVTHTLWLSITTLSEGGKVYRLSIAAPSGWSVLAELHSADQIAADPLTGGCWVATDSGVVRVSDTGILTTYLPELHILDISVNPVNGDCYYVGRAQDGSRTEAGRIPGDPDRQPETILVDASGYFAQIQVLPGEGQVGFLINEASSHQLLRFDAAGQLVGRLGDFSPFLDFALE
ncbi:MAG: hypothetical protein IID14_07250 [Candidatus Marinimicrobia bacterium]|nr:hypothetical protein [Candidatus Neomarinimicrobiota bacterium]